MLAAMIRYLELIKISRYKIVRILNNGTEKKLINRDGRQGCSSHHYNIYEQNTSNTDKVTD
jgi:hypothetical protein